MGVRLFCATVWLLAMAHAHALALAGRYEYSKWVCSSSTSTFACARFSLSSLIFNGKEKEMTKHTRPRPNRAPMSHQPWNWMENVGSMDGCRIVIRGIPQEREWARMESKWCWI